MGKGKGQKIDPEKWVEEYGDYLYRFALSRIKDPTMAEEVVQETFLAALQSLPSFSGQSTFKTWLVGIMKHKIVDQIRKSYRERPYETVETLSRSDEELFDRSGKWNFGPVEWNANPNEISEHREFWSIFRKCLSGLPPHHYEVFTMREMDGMESQEICTNLDISSTNLWVMLHRARAALRKCLESNWFQSGGDGD
jgi:RNA polymerase sigma-70 factor (ECF subfamily)